MSQKSLHLGWSIVAQAQRREITKIAAEIGIRPIFLKAVWADEILFEGRGGRHGADIDVFCPGLNFRRLAEALERAGYQRKIVKGYWATSQFGDKEWLFMPTNGGLPLDLHRALSAHYPSCTEEFSSRAKPYLTREGEEIWSLDEVDQILFCAIHHVNHNFELDGRHFNDVVALLRKFPIDWNALQARAQKYKLDVPVALLVEAMRIAVADAEHLPDPAFFLSSGHRTRAFAWAKTWVQTSKGLSRTSRAQTETHGYRDMLYRIPRLTERYMDPLSLPIKYVALRVLDRFWPRANSIDQCRGRKSQNDIVF